MLGIFNLLINISLSVTSSFTLSLSEEKLITNFAITKITDSLNLSLSFSLELNLLETWETKSIDRSIKR